MAVPGQVMNLTLTKVRRSDGTPAVRLKWAHLPETGGVGQPYYEIMRQIGSPSSILIEQIDEHDGVPTFIEYVDFIGVETATYAVRGINASGSGPFSTSATIVIAPPAAMGNVVTSQVIRSDGKVGVNFAFDYMNGVTSYRLIRQDSFGPAVYNYNQPGVAPSNRRIVYQDFFVSSPDTYTYTLRAIDGTMLGATSQHVVNLTATDGGVPGTGSVITSPYVGGHTNGVVRWSFFDVWGTGGNDRRYIFEINPNEGGSPQVSKAINAATNAGPNRGAVLQEGQSTAPVLSFSGLILTQSHYEAMESWFDKRILIELKDDLGRTFRGVFSSFDPTRSRRPYNPWYHTYSAQFTCYGYKNASGQIRYGRF